MITPTIQARLQLTILTRDILALGDGRRISDPAKADVLNQNMCTTARGGAISFQIFVPRGHFGLLAVYWYRRPGPNFMSPEHIHRGATIPNKVEGEFGKSGINCREHSAGELPA